LVKYDALTNVVNDTAVIPLAPGGNSILVFCFAEKPFKLAVKLPVLHSNLIAQIAVRKLHFQHRTAIRIAWAP